MTFDANVRDVRERRREIAAADAVTRVRVILGDLADQSTVDELEEGQIVDCDEGVFYVARVGPVWFTVNLKGPMLRPAAVHMHYEVVGRRRRGRSEWLSRRVRDWRDVADIWPLPDR